MGILPWLRLMRLSNVFTAVADVLMGYWFSKDAYPPPAALGLLAAASAALYSAGMVLNDRFDLEQDRRERPHRPLPSGAISPRAASRLGWGLLATGCLLALVAGWWEPTPLVPWWRCGVVGVLLACTIVAYDGWLKPTFLGPVAMGACRCGNVLLGMSLASSTPFSPIPFDRVQWVIALGLGIYVTGITLFARTEARESERIPLLAALLLMLSGFVVLGLYPLVPTTLANRPWRHPDLTVWWLLLGVVALPLVRRGIRALARPEPHYVQHVVKLALFSRTLR